MMQKTIAVLAFVAAAIGSTNSCLAVTDEEACFNESGEIALEVCSRVIASGMYSGELLAPFHFNRGDAYYDKGDYDRAIADYNEAIQLDPKLAFAWNHRGNAYYVKGDYDRAIADYNEAIRVDPKRAAAWSNRGNAYYVKGDYDRAIADYNEAIQLDPKYALAYYGRGLAKERKGDQSGDADLAAARRINPNIGK